MSKQVRNLLIFTLILAVLALVFAGDIIGTIFSGLFAGAVVTTAYTYFKNKKDD